jgi:LemA protein
MLILTVLLVILFVLVICLVLYAILIYNKNKELEIKLSELFANMESTKNKLNRVYSEVASLLTKYSIHEADILKAVASGQANIQILLSKYPHLKADNLFMNASDRWNNLYNELQGYLLDYNQTITKYNVSVMRFPDTLMCRILKFKQKTHARIQ